MQSGKIAPTFRQIFSAALRPKNADTNSQQHGQQREPEREPSHEEALEALDLLTQQDEFQRNALRADLSESEGRWVISVCDGKGNQLRVIRGVEIVRLLDRAGLGKAGPSRGRILDRRV